MGALGGIMARDPQEVRWERLARMSRSMMLRGAVRREAYGNGTVRLLHQDRSKEPSALRQGGFAVTRGGNNYVLAWDGLPEGIGDQEEAARSLTAEELTARILDAYLSADSAWFASLHGSFALMLYDERYRELWLVRDRMGSRPLFYLRDGTQFCFASDIQAIAHAAEEPLCVERDRLRLHLSAPCGTYTASDLYRDIESLPPGHCGVSSALGLQVFAYASPMDAAEEPSPCTPSVTPTDFCPDANTLRRYLTEALFAFGYPQFDCLMPGVLHALESLPPTKKQEPLGLADPTHLWHAAYACERADRLGTMRQRSLVSLSARCPPRSERERKRMDRLLCELLHDTNTSLLSSLLGNDWHTIIQQEKNTERRIRMQGMLYQTILWFEHYPIYAE